MAVITTGWILVVLFLLTGIFKLIQTKEQIISKGAAWANDFEPLHIKLIGVVELILAIVLGIGLFLHIPILAKISAGMMGPIMLGALVIHLKRKEIGFIVVTAVTAGLAFYLASFYR